MKKIYLLTFAGFLAISPQASFEAAAAATSVVVSEDVDAGTVMSRIVRQHVVMQRAFLEGKTPEESDFSAAGIVLSDTWELLNDNKEKIAGIGDKYTSWVVSISPEGADYLTLAITRRTLMVISELSSFEKMQEVVEKTKHLLSGHSLNVSEAVAWELFKTHEDERDEIIAQTFKLMSPENQGDTISILVSGIRELGSDRESIVNKIQENRDDSEFETSTIQLLRKFSGI